MNEPVPSRPPKARSWEELREEVQTWKASGEAVVFTNGCFDLFHAGHAHYLRAARALGDHLIIGLNSDDSVRGLKGPSRPLVPQQDRLEVLTSLEFVDRVTLFDQETPLELLRFLVPDILVKGADYEGKLVVGRDVVEAAGGRVELIEFLPGRSTSDLIRKILEACPKQTDS